MKAKNSMKKAPGSSGKVAAGTHKVGVVEPVIAGAKDRLGMLPITGGNIGKKAKAGNMKGLKADLTGGYPAKKKKK